MTEAKTSTEVRIESLEQAIAEYRVAWFNSLSETQMKRYEDAIDSCQRAIERLLGHR